MVGRGSTGALLQFNTRSMDYRLCSQRAENKVHQHCWYCKSCQSPSQPPGPPQPQIALGPAAILTSILGHVVLAKSESDPWSQSLGTARTRKPLACAAPRAQQCLTLLERRINCDILAADSSHLIQLPATNSPCEKQGLKLVGETSPDPRLPSHWFCPSLNIPKNPFHPDPPAYF